MERTILLIVKNKKYASMAIESLGNSGFKVLHADNSVNALKTISSLSAIIDFIIIDTKLTEEADGIELAKILIKEYQIPLAFLLNSVDKEIVQQIEKVTKFGFIKKEKNCYALVNYVKLVLQISSRDKYNSLRINEHTLSEEKPSSIVNPTLFSTILENSTIGIIFLKNRKIVWTNSRFKEIFKITSEKIEGMDTINFYADEKDYWEVGSRAYSVLAQGKKAELEIEMKKMDGSKFWIRLEGKALDYNRPQEGTIWIFEDITERKKGQEAIALEKTIIDGIFESVPGMVSLSDDKWNLIKWNKRLEEMTGFLENELIKMTALDLFKSDNKSVKVIAECINKAMENGFGEAEVQIKNKEGLVRTIYYTASPLEINNKKYFTGLGIDITETKNIQNELRIQKDKLESIYSSVEIGIGVVINRELKEVNNNFCNMIGYEKQEILGRNTSFLYKYNRDYELIGDISDFSKDKINESHEREVTWLKKDGTQILVLLRVAPIDRNNPKGGVAFSAWDITERKQIEEKIINSEARYRNLIDNMNEGFFISNLDTRITFANKALAKIIGFDEPDQLLNHSFKDFIDPSEKDVSIEQIKEAIRKRNVGVTFTFRIIKRDSSFAYVKVRPSLLHDSDKITGIMGLITDITEQKRYEEALIISEERFRQVSESAHEWIWEVDVNGLYIYSNSVVEQIVGYKPSEIIGVKYYYDFLNEDSKVLYTSKFQEITSNHKEIYKLEHSIIHKNGFEIILEATGVPVFDSKNNLIGYRGTNIDITQRKLAEKKIKEAESRYRTLFEQSPDGIIVINPTNGRFLDFNETAHQQLGYTKEEFSKLSIPDLDLIDDQAQIKERIDYIFKNKSADFETIHKTKSGDPRNVHVKVRVLEIDDNILYLCIVRDITFRKKFEEQLLIKDFALRSSFHAIGLADMNGNVIFVNEAYIKMWGFNDEKEALSTNIQNIIKTDEHTVSIQQHVVKLLMSGSGVFLEREVINLKGKSFFVQLSANVVLSPDGNPICLMATFTDITDKRKSEELIALLSHSIKSVAQGVSITDLNNNILFVNKSFLETYGFNDEEVIGNNISIVGASKTINYLEIIEHTFKGGWKGELLNRKKDGTEFPIYLSTSPVFNEDGDVIALVGITTDITERKRAEEELKKSYAVLEATLESTGDAILVVDNKNRVVKMNKNFIKMWNVPKEFTPGIDDDNLLAFVADQISNRENFIKKVKELYNSVDAISFDIIELKDGRVLERYSQPEMVEGKAFGRVWSFRDITERKHTEEELDKYRHKLEELIEQRTKELQEVNSLLQEEIQKVKEAELTVKLALEKEIELSQFKSRFVSTASHEFRTPLTTILASADLLELYGRSWPEEKYFEYVKKIQNTVEYMTELINDVLTYSKSETGKIKFNPMEVDLHQLESNIVNNAKLSAPGNLNFIFDYKVNRKVFILDPRLITQILTNLISNSIKYSPDGGDIKLITFIKDNNLIISVSDNGIGIKEEDQETLFEPFNRGQNIGTIPGTGLGLSIVKISADIHRAKINLKSSLDKGTEVSLILNIE